MSANLKAFRTSAPEKLDSSISKVLPQITDPDLQALLRTFKVDSISLEADGEPLHGRTLLNKALDEAEQLTLVFLRRKDDVPATASSEGLPVPEAPAPPREREELMDAFRTAVRARRFVSIKWFRDIWLPEQKFSWSKDPELVKVVLRAAIDEGMLRKEQIPNPNNPAHPTTTLKEGNTASKPVNLGNESESNAQRRTFTPITIPGKPLSITVLEGR